MLLLGKLGGFETLCKQFFEIFGTKKQKEKTVKNRKYQEKSKKRNFDGDILLISTDISTEISKTLFPNLGI